jgi:hypothetical protein
LGEPGEAGSPGTPIEGGSIVRRWCSPS